jgi:hypothetical protein
MSIQRRKEVSPSMLSKLTLANVQQVEKWNGSRKLRTSHGGETKPSSMLGLLDLIDHHSDHNSKSIISELSTSCKSPLADKNTSSIEFIPAGANLETINKKSNYPRDINSSSLIKNDMSSVGGKNVSYSVQYRNTLKCDSDLDIILPESTGTPLDTDRNKVQSSHSEHCEQIPVKKELRSLSLLECLRRKKNSIAKSDSCRTENGIGVQCDITGKEVTSVNSRNLFQDIVSSVAKSMHSKRHDLLDDMKKNSLSPTSIPDMKTRLPQTALKAMLKQEIAGNDMQAKSVNSLAR